MLTERAFTGTEKQNSIEQLDLTNPDVLLEKVKQLVPDSKKEEMFENAEVNKLGEHVRYYRRVGPGEINALLSGKTITPLTNPTIRNDFDENKSWLIESFSHHSEKLSTEFQKMLPEFIDSLGPDPTLEEFIELSLKEIPKYDLFKLHTRQTQRVSNYYGLLSLSVGVPFIGPQGFYEKEGEIVGSCIVELVIPNEDVIINPPSGGLRENEKEVNTLELKPEWLVDVYVSPEDFSERFIDVPNSPLKNEYGKAGSENADHWLPSDAHNLIMRYKQDHSFENLIPISKIPDTDINNPDLKKPIL